MEYSETDDMCLHRDDHWIDEIRLLGVDMAPHLRLVTKFRYKTSGLSGDEWRTSTIWQCTPSVATQMHGELEEDKDGGWLSFDGGYSGKLDVGCAALYPGIWSSQPDLHTLRITAMDFCRKGRVLYRSTYDDKPMPLLVVAGHLPWAFVKASDEPLGTDGAWEDMRHLCFQPGCALLACSTYRLKHLYNRDGKAEAAVARRYTLGNPVREVSLIRRFCHLHLRRGDCGLEDADNNYQVIDGPGTQEAADATAFHSPAQRVTWEFKP